jgi:nicotinamidase-related amidase
MPETLVHDWHIEQREYERQESRRGRRHAYESLVPARTALVVVDMVPFFVTGNPYCLGIVPVIDRLACALRTAGGLVAWIFPAVAPPTPAAVEFYGPEIAARYAAGGGTGPLEGRLAKGLTAEPGDLLAEKSASSAFFPGASPLPLLLAERSIDTVLITGTVTNVCCESSARDASTLGFRVIMVADGTATGRDQDHNATLRTIYRSFGDVRPASEVRELIGSAAG